MLTAQQVAQMLGLSARAVYDLAASKRLACYRVGAGGSAVRFEPDDVAAYKAACRSSGTSATSAGASASVVSLRDAGTDFRKRRAVRERSSHL